MRHKPDGKRAAQGSLIAFGAIEVCGANGFVERLMRRWNA